MSSEELENFKSKIRNIAEEEIYEDEQEIRLNEIYEILTLLLDEEIEKILKENEIYNIPMPPIQATMDFFYRALFTFKERHNL